MGTKLPWSGYCAYAWYGLDDPVVGADVVDEGGDSAGGDGASRRKASNWGFGDSREAGSYQFWVMLVNGSNMKVSLEIDSPEANLTWIHACSKCSTLDRSSPGRGVQTHRCTCNHR